MEAESLAATCTLAFAVAREGVEAVPPVEPPAPMRSFLYVATLPKRAMSVAQRVLEDDHEFRQRVIARATERNVGTEGYRWLTEVAGSSSEGSTFSRLADRAEQTSPEQTSPEPAAPEPSVPPMPAPPEVAPVAPVTGAVPPMPTPPSSVPAVPATGAVPPMPAPPSGDSSDDAATADAIEDELANLRSLVDRLADERTVVRSSVDDLETEVADRRDESSALTDEIQSLRGDVHAARQAEQVAAEEAAAQAAAERTAADLAATEMAAADLAAAEQRVAAAESERETLQRTVARLDAERLDIEARLQTSEAAVADATAALEARDADLSATKARLDQTMTALDEQRSAAGDAQSAGLAELAEVRSSLEEQIRTTGAELTQTRQALAAADAELTSVRDELVASRTQVEELRAELEAVRSEQAAAVADVAAAKADAEVAQAQAEAAQAEAANAQSESEAARADAEAARADAEAARAEAEQAEVEAANAAADAAAARAEAATADTDLMSLRETLSTSERSLTEANARVTGLEADLAATNDKLTTAEGIAAQVAFLREELGNAQNEREELITQLEVSEQARTDIERQLTSVSSQWRDLQMELVKLGEHRAAVERELEELLAERQSTMAERAKLFGDLGAQLGRVESERDLLATQLAVTRDHLDGTRAAFAEASEAISVKLDDTGQRLDVLDADVAGAEDATGRLAAAVSATSSVIDGAAPSSVEAADDAANDEPANAEPANAEAVMGEAVIDDLAPEAEPTEGSVEVDPFLAAPDAPAGATSELEDTAFGTAEPEAAEPAVDADDPFAEAGAAVESGVDELQSGWDPFDNDPGFAPAMPGETDLEVAAAAWLPDGTDLTDDLTEGPDGEGESFAAGSEDAADSTVRPEADSVNLPEADSTDVAEIDEPGEESESERSVPELAADDLDEALSSQGFGAVESTLGDSDSVDAPSPDTDAVRETDTESGADPSPSAEAPAEAEAPLEADTDVEDVAVDAGVDLTVADSERRRIVVPADVADDTLAATRFVVGAEDVVLLIDGDAVAELGWPSMDPAARREVLVERLTELAAETGAAPDLVFDGAVGDDSELPVSKSVRVRLTASGIEPATALGALVDTYPRHWPVAVITDNSEVGDDAARRGASLITNAHFLDLFLVK